MSNETKKPKNYLEYCANDTIDKLIKRLHDGGAYLLVRDEKQMIIDFYMKNQPKDKL